MKQTLTKWNKFLNEDIQSHYGDDYISFKKKAEKIASRGVNIPDSKTEVDLLLEKVIDVADEHFERIGSGAYRIAYELDSGLVIKVAHAYGGIKDNEAEFELTKEPEFSDVLLEVQDSGPHYFWIVTERVDVFDDCSDMVFHFDFIEKRQDEIMEHVDGFSTLCAFFSDLVQFCVVHRINREDGSKRLHDDFPEDTPPYEVFKELAENADKNFNSLIRLLMKKPVNKVEIGPRNSGVDKNGNWVMLDPSVTFHDKNATYFLAQYLKEQLQKYKNYQISKKELFERIQEDEAQFYGKNYKEFKKKATEAYKKTQKLSEVKFLAEDYFGIPLSNKGANRIVHKMDDGRVIKIARGKRSVSDNKKEFKISKDPQFSDIVVQVEDSGPDFIWIVTEKVRPLNNWKELVFHFDAFKNQKNLFQKLDKYVPDPFENFFPNYIEFVEVVENAQKNVEDLVEYLSKFYPKDYVKTFIRIAMKANKIKGQRLEKFQKLFLRHRPMISDWRPDNMGIDSNGNIVLIDPTIEAPKKALGKDAHEFLGRKNNE